MEKVISTSELNEILLELIESAETYYSQSHSYFEDMYYTGCRSIEPLLIDRWKYLNGNVILSTVKTEAIRFFKPSKLSHDLLASIDDTLPPSNGLKYVQITAEFRKYINLNPIYCGYILTDSFIF